MNAREGDPDDRIIVVEDGRGLRRLCHTSSVETRMRQLRRGRANGPTLAHVAEPDPWSHLVKQTAQWLLEDAWVEGEWFAVDMDGIAAALDRARAEVAAGRGRTDSFARAHEIRLDRALEERLNRALRDGETRTLLVRRLVIAELERRERDDGA